MTTPANTSDALFPGRAFVSTVLAVLETKHRMTGELLVRYLQRAAMAGLIIGVFYATNFSIVSLFSSVEANGEPLTGVGRLLGAMAFGPALVFIYYTKSELLTSNMMVVCIGTYYKRISWLRGLRIMAFCLLGNSLGGLLLALLMRMSTLSGGATGEQMQSAVEHKLAYLASASGCLDLFVRAIFCNFMINLAMLLIYNGFIHEDILKSTTMMIAVFVFAFVGFEHSVANTVLFSIVGLRYGIDVLAALAQVGICLLGNFVGGGLLIGMYYAYANDDTKYLARHPEG